VRGEAKGGQAGSVVHLGEVRDEAVLGGGAGDVEGEEGPEPVVGAAGPHELLPQRQREMGIVRSSSASAAAGVASL
jgi:hypothetical protein